MRETLVCIQVQPQRQRSFADIIEVPLQFASLETLYGVARQLFKFGIALEAQVVAGQLVVPRLVGEAGNGTAIDLLLLGAQPVLIEENRETLVKPGVVRVAINFTAQHAERGRDLFHFHQARQVTLQHARVFGRTRASWLRGFGGCVHLERLAGAMAWSCVLIGVSGSLTFLADERRVGKKWRTRR